MIENNMIRPKITEHISRQKGVIVRRTIIIKKSDTVSIFTFYKKPGLSEYTARCDALVQVLEQAGTISIRSNRCSLSKNEMIIMPTGKPQAATKNSKRCI